MTNTDTTESVVGLTNGLTGLAVVGIALKAVGNIFRTTKDRVNESVKSNKKGDIKWL